MATKKRLIPWATNIAEGDLPEELYTAAYHVESAMQKAGAVAGKDYSYSDFFGIASTLVNGMIGRGYIGQHKYPTDQMTPDPNKKNRLRS
jgi:hypothetical protein